MEKNAFDNYVKAGEVVKHIMASLKLNPGIRILDLAGEIEGEIVRRGAKPAFPVNISINDIAAHYTPEPGDETTIGAEDIVKIDLGAHVDGYIADAAFSFCAKGAKEAAMIKASRDAVESAVKMMKPGTRLCDVSAAIEDVINASGFRPVANLVGHRLERFAFHGSPSVMNVRNSERYELKPDDVFAIEPFVTDGSGYVKDSQTMIYSYAADRLGRLPESREILAKSKLELNGLPFCKRWFSMTPLKFDLAARQLVAVGAIRPHAILREVGGGKVAQSEHTVIVRDKPVVTTL